MALSDTSGSEMLITPKNRKFSSGAQLASIDSRRDISGWEELEIVEKSTLDEDLHYVKARGIDLIKIDAEGSEQQVLLGAKETISQYKPSILIELLSLENFEHTSDWLHNLGYGAGRPLDGFGFLDDAKSHVGAFATNYLFERKI
jgi:hypothetical protein